MKITSKDESSTYWVFNHLDFGIGVEYPLPCHFTTERISKELHLLCFFTIQDCFSYPEFVFLHEVEDCSLEVCEELC